MKNLLFFFLSIFFAISVNTTIAFSFEITPAQTIGAISSLRLNIEEQKHKIVQGGVLVIASGIVPFDIKREQVKPTLLAALEALKQNYPKCEWFSIYLSPESDDGFYVGRAEYKEGRLELFYDIPSQKQIDEWNNENTGISPYLFKPDRKTFETAIKARLLYTQVIKVHKNKIPSHDAICKLVGKKMNIPAKKINELVRYIDAYYTIDGWGSEKMILK